MEPFERLRDAMIFSGCREQDLTRLAEIGAVREFRDGQLLFTLGDPARELLVIASGKVQLELPVSVLGEVRNIAFETKEPGSVIGWSALAAPSRLTLSARAVGRTTVLAFRQEDLFGLFDEEPVFGLQVLKNALSVVRLRLELTQRMCLLEIQRGLDET